MIRVIRKALPSFFLGACASAGHSPASPVEVHVAARDPAPARGDCPAAPERFAPPPGSRTLVTPPPDRTRALNVAKVGTWYGTEGPRLDRVLVAPDGEVVAVGAGRLLRSRDGVSFADATAPLPAKALLWKGADRYLATGASLAHSEDDGATWTVFEPFDPEGDIADLAGTGADLYAVGAVLAAGRPVAARSRDSGATWHPIPLPVERGALVAVAVRPRPSGHEILAGGVEGQGPSSTALLLSSTDCGATWARIPVRAGEKAVRALCATASAIVVATPGGIQVGDRWTPIEGVAALACRDPVILGAAEDGTVTRSTDGGNTWTRERLEGALRGVDLAADGSIYVAGDSLFRRLPAGR